MGWELLMDGELTITHGEFTVKQGEYGFDRLYVRRDLIIGCLYAVGKRHFRVKTFLYRTHGKSIFEVYECDSMGECLMHIESTLSIVRVGHDGSKTQSMESIELRTACLKCDCDLTVVKFNNPQFIQSWDFSTNKIIGGGE